MIKPVKSDWSGFNETKSIVHGLVTLFVEVGKWQANIAFRVVNQGSYLILRYPGLKLFKGQWIVSKEVWWGKMEMLY